MLQLGNVDLAFSEKSKVYDDYTKSNFIVKYSRNVIRRVILDNIPQDGSILELNGGTGSDAIFFVKKGYSVHLIDISKGMIEKSKEKVTSQEIKQKFTIQRKSFENLQDLPAHHFDYIFSNFGGLNCTPNLKSVLNQFSYLLKDTGFITLVIMPPICPWELLQIFWNPKMGLRRVPAIFGVPIKANISGIKFLTYYYTVNTVKKLFNKNYTVLSIKSISLFSPPSFLDYFPIKYPKLFRKLLHLDQRFSAYYPFYNYGDFFILTLSYKNFKE